MKKLVLVAGLIAALFLSFVVLPDTAFAAWKPLGVKEEKDSTGEVLLTILLVGATVWFVYSKNKDKDENELVSVERITSYSHHAKNKNQLLDIKFNLGFRALNDPMTISNNQHNNQQFVPRLEISVLSWK